MSYILDALKKAAEQRGDNAPGFRRLVTAPPAHAGDRRTWIRTGVVTACAVAAGIVAFVALRPAPIMTTVVPPKAAVVTRAPAQAPPVPAQVPRAPVELPRAPAEMPRAPADVRRAPAVAAPPPQVAAPVVSAPRVEAPPPAAPVSRPAPLAVAPRPTPPVAPAAPATATTSPPTPASAGDARLKLEVLVYSDVASERMVFINGRKYVQGDTVAERVRVEEIQADGVVLSEHGRRFTLRH